MWGEGSPSFDFAHVRDRLRQALQRRRLPGVPAQRLMAPRPRPGWRPERPLPGGRPAAVLVLVYADRGRAWLALTVRPGHLVRHAGQVSLPGGAIEDGEVAVRAALREAREEIGLDEPELEILGELSPLHVPASGFELRPVVAALGRPPRLVPEPREVSRILRVPLERLADPARRGVERRTVAGLSLEVPYFLVEGERVWGATAMILAELLVLLGAGLEP